MCKNESICIVNIYYYLSNCFALVLFPLFK